MTIEEAVKYLVDNDKYENEWSGAGMWEAVLQVVKPENAAILCEDFLDDLLEKAKNF
jgi:hypothetical protein